jgi:hypothetical protein
MDNFWFNFTLEIAFLSLLGVIYYFWQKRKIIRYEENKIPLVMNFLLQACLNQKQEKAEPELDELILAIDDYLKHPETPPPIILLKNFCHSKVCSHELRQHIEDGLKELE